MSVGDAVGVAGALVEWPPVGGTTSFELLVGDSVGGSALTRSLALFAKPTTVSWTPVTPPAIARPPHRPARKTPVTAATVLSRR